MLNSWVIDTEDQMMAVGHQTEWYRYYPVGNNAALTSTDCTNANFDCSILGCGFKKLCSVAFFCICGELKKMTWFMVMQLC